MAKSRNKQTANTTSSKTAITLTIPKNKVVSKAQQTFNRLVKRIETLQHDITLTNQLLGEKMEYYGKQIHPLEKQSVLLRKQVVKLLFPFYIDKKPLAKKDKNILKNILIQQLNTIFSLSNEKPDDELNTVFEALLGVSYDDAVQQEAAEMKQEMADMFESMGFKMDLSDFDENASQEEMARKMKELQEQLFEQAANFTDSQKTRKKSKKQLAKEEREKLIAETKNKSIGRIYKQLAKVLHPDLEQDPEQRSRKEIWMRELTAAYEKKDLHALLRLELEWIQKEENNLEQLTEEKLDIYNEVLKEQAADLEQEKYMLLEHPRYHPLRRFVRFSDQLKYLNLTQQKKNMQENLKSLENSVTRLQTEHALDEVKEVISVFREYRF